MIGLAGDEREKEVKQNAMVERGWKWMDRCPHDCGSAWRFDKRLVVVLLQDV